MSSGRIYLSYRISSRRVWSGCTFLVVLIFPLRILFWNNVLNIKVTPKLSSIMWCTLRVTGEFTTPLCYTNPFPRHSSRVFFGYELSSFTTQTVYKAHVHHRCTSMSTVVVDKICYEHANLMILPGRRTTRRVFIFIFIYFHKKSSRMTQEPIQVLTAEKFGRSHYQLHRGEGHRLLPSFGRLDTWSQAITRPADNTWATVAFSAWEERILPKSSWVSVMSHWLQQRG